MNNTISLKTFTVALAGILIAAGGYFFITAPSADALTPLSSVTSGDLIRGEATPAVYYFGADGQRYVFPNSNTYFTWYDNFDNVKFLSDSDLGTIKIGGNVTYRPGKLMVKIQSNPKTYAVAANGTLRHITSGAIAESYYGSAWNKQVHDVPDSFWGNYNEGAPINSASEYNPATALNVASNINTDKSLSAPVEMNVFSSGYSPIDTTISAGRSIRFINNDTVPHTFTGEDLSWGTGTIQPGANKIVNFKKAGTFPFFDSYKSANTGAIYVQ